MKKVLNRAKTPTPKFFKVLRNIGIYIRGKLTAYRKGNNYNDSWRKRK